MDQSPNPTRRRFRVHDLVVDLDQQTVRRHGQELELPDLSFRLLASLVRRAPDKVSKDDLIRDIWDNIVVSDETLAQRVRLLRQSLGEDSQNPRIISSVRGRGYRLICKVEPLDPGRGPAARWLTSPLLAAIAATVAIAIIGFWVAMHDGRNLTTAAETIAVLPFSDLSADKGNRHFADGMQEELLTRLTSIGEISVLSRTSVEVYRATDLSVPEIGRRTGADAIIEGSVRIAENSVRITVQLIDADTDLHLWSANFDRELTVANLFLIQEEVADKIARALQLEYEIGTAPEAVVLPTNDIEAYNAYLLGRYHTFRQTNDDLVLAVSWLEQAIRLDPQFAKAYASLGWAYSFLGTTYGTLTPDEAFSNARAAALSALALDGDLSDARSLYADILTWHDWDFRAAEREYLRTIEIDPLNVLGYALFLSTQLRHEEALAMIERLLQSAPNDPYVWVNAAWRYLNAGRIEKAKEAALRAAGHPDANSALGLIHLAAGNVDAAIGVFEEDRDQHGNEPTQLSNLAIAYALSGRVSESQALLFELQAQSSTRYVSPVLLASVYFSAGDADRGFAMLEAAVANRAREVIFIQVSQVLANYRNDPRYQALLLEIGFTR